jgi:hypothetical protein
MREETVLRMTQLLCSGGRSRSIHFYNILTFALVLGSRGAIEAVHLAAVDDLAEREVGVPAGAFVTIQLADGGKGMNFSAGGVPASRRSNPCAKNADLLSSCPTT